MIPTTTHEKLVNGRNYLAKNGWCQHTLFMFDNNFVPIAACARGGLIIGNLGAKSHLDTYTAEGEMVDAVAVLAGIVRERHPEMIIPIKLVGLSTILPSDNSLTLDPAAENRLIVARWNDNFAKTRVEVLDLFDEAIAKTAPEPKLDKLSEPCYDLTELSTLSRDSVEPFSESQVEVLHAC